MQCERPDGASYEGTDCDDTAWGVNPGQSEVCIDSVGYGGVDEDCDGDIDDADDDIDCADVYLCGSLTDDLELDPDLTYEASCDLTIAAGLTLTIGEGATLRLHPDVSLWVGYSTEGNLVMDGGTITGLDAIPGAWGLVYLGANATSSDFNNATIEYGGGTGYGNLALSGSSTTISGTTISNSASAGLIMWYESASLITNSSFLDNDTYGIACWGYSGSLDCIAGEDDSFTGNTLSGNLFPLTMSPDDATNTVAAGSNELTGNDWDMVYLAAYDVTSDTTWGALDIPRYLSGSISVTDSAVLTLTAGTEVAVAEASGIYVGDTNYGQVEVQGTEDEPVLLTGVIQDQGSWNGVRFGPYALASTLEGLIIEYAGYYDGGLRFSQNTSGISVVNSTFRDNAGAGARLYDDSAAAFTGCTFEDNETHGVQLEAGSAFYDAFSDNLATGNGEFGVELPTTQANYLVDTSSVAGNGIGGIGLLGETITANSEWPTLDDSYHILESFSVGNATSQPHLTLNAGSNFFAHDSVRVTIGGTAGDLVISGTEEAPVVFEHVDGEVGGWRGIHIDTEAGSGTVWDWMEIRHAGSSDAALLIEGNLALTNGLIEDNANYGVFVESTSIFIIEDSVVQNNTGTGLSIEGTDVLNGFARNVITGNGGYPLQISADNVAFLDTDSAYTGNGSDCILLDSAWTTASGDATWSDLGLPYLAPSYFSLAAGYDFTFEPGIILRFALESGLSVDGVLHADGVRFTSIKDLAPEEFDCASVSSPGSGNWEEVLFGTGSDGSEVINSTFEYGGMMPTSYDMVWGKDYDGWAGNVMFSGPDMIFSGNTSTNSGSHGVGCTSDRYGDNGYQGSSDLAAENTFYDNYSGDVGPYCP